MNQRYINIPLLLGLLFITSHSNSQTPRGRVQIQEGTLVTDRGTLLRGAFVATDNRWNEMPKREEISAIKNLGLNCVHLYAENPWDTSVTAHPKPGYRMNEVDSLVKWTAEDSLYLILTMAGWTPEKDTFLFDFWRLYADRYKDQTHLIYEICNEPLSQDIPYDSPILVMEKLAYDTIRHFAPETHIVLMSYPFLNDAENALLDIQRLVAGIDWTNASIAVHGYIQSTEDNYFFIKTLQDSGYAVINTEVPIITDDWINIYLNLANTRNFENNFISYISFLEVQDIVNNPVCYKDRIESSEIRWIPDFKNWPYNLLEINYSDPFKPFYAAFCDECGRGLSYTDELNMWIIDTTNRYESHMACYNMNFEETPDSILLTFSYMDNANRVEVRLDSINGRLVCNASVPKVNWATPTTFSFPLNSFEGVHNVFLLFKNNSYFAGILEKIQFKKKIYTSIGHYKQDIGSFNLYPNPALDQLTIKTDETAEIKIFNIYGQLKLQKEIFKNESTVSVKDLKPGYYIVKITSNTQSHSEILIIKNR